MKRYVPNQNLVIKHSSFLCGDGTEFDFVPWEPQSRRDALAKANEHEYDLRRSVEQREGRGTLTERQYRRAVTGQPIDPQPTGSVTGTSTPREESNPFSALLAMKRKMNPAYESELREKEAAWNAEHEAKQRRAELESTTEYKMMNEHAKYAYRSVVNDTNSDQVSIRAELVKIAAEGDVQRYWEIVAEQGLDKTLVTAKPTEPPPPVALPDLQLPPIDLNVDC
jgi:hypothetical protein